MTIHSDHPFLPPEDQRDPVRRFRARLPAPVTVWTTGAGADRVGLTVSSVLVADGDPARILALVDEDSALADAIATTRTVAVSVLTWEQRALADAFAGTAPAPGGAFRLADWDQTAWGPVLSGSPGWVGARLVEGETRHAGWALLLEALVESVEVTGETEVLTHTRGRYRRG
ncbi:MAG: flavin reductase [Geodermatophilaceae bacterium]|nr:flavin reductase [Geodermatophilaceae bacterium]